MFFIRDGSIYPIEKTVQKIDGRMIHESNFQLQEKDALVFVSDGMIHAGASKILKLGWSCQEVAHYLETLCIHQISAVKITKALLGVCEDL